MAPQATSKNILATRQVSAYNERMDWTSIIKELAPYYEQRAIAKQAGLAESAITRMKSGELTRVSYDAGCKIMEMVAKVRRRKPRA